MLTTIFLICVVTQCIYALCYLVFAGRSTPVQIEERKPVTVLICAHDEAHNLKSNLPHILEQDYHDPAGKALFEVLVIDDHSTDDTQQILQAMADQYGNLRWQSLDGSEKGKQNALVRGLIIASHDLLALTDADSRPESKQWLTLIIAPLHAGKEIVAGYGAYTKQAGWLNGFVRWETAHSFMQWSTYAAAGMPYMALGRNMACTKSTLRNATLHPLWNKLKSGHDDLIVQTGATSGNMAIIATPGSITLSHPPETFRDWARQKQRHLSTGKYYKEPARSLLGVYALSHAGMWITFLLLCFTTGWPTTGLMLLCLRMPLAWLAFRRSTKQLHAPDTFFAWLAGDCGWMIYNFAFLPYITWKNKTSWK